MGAEWLHSNRQKDGGMDITKLIIFFFFNFAKGGKKEQILVVCFLLGDSPASEFYMPTFRSTLSLTSS